MGFVGSGNTVDAVFGDFSAPSSPRIDGVVPGTSLLLSSACTNPGCEARPLVERDGRMCCNKCGFSIEMRTIDYLSRPVPKEKEPAQSTGSQDDSLRRGFEVVSAVPITW